MDLNELKKLVNEELKKSKLQEATDVTVPGRNLKQKPDSHKTIIQKMKSVFKKDQEDSEEPTQAIPGISIDPSAKTVLKKGTQSIVQPEIENPEQFYKGILRLHNAIRDKLDLELKNEEAYEIVREITSQEIEKLRAKYPELGIGSKLG